MSASLSRAFPSLLTGSQPSTEMTSGCVRVSVPNNLACAILVIASGVTNAAPRLETIEMLQLKESGARQITSAHAHCLILQEPSDPVAQGADGSANAEAIAELRLLTGFTWEQLARLFSVSRRSVHMWASGESMSRENEEHLHRMLGVVRRANCGEASRNRAALLSVDPTSDQCAFDRLIQGDYEAALRILSPSSQQLAAEELPWSPSTARLKGRALPSPEVLLAARQDEKPLIPRPARAVRYRKAHREA